MKYYRYFKRKILLLTIISAFCGVILSDNPLITLAAQSQSASADTASFMYLPAPTSLRELFDAEYYLLMYPDLAKIGEMQNPDALFEHFMRYGLAERRKCSPYLDIARYISDNADLSLSFGENLDSYVSHYFMVGKAEGRDSGASNFDLLIQSKLAPYGSYVNLTRLTEKFEHNNTANTLALESIQQIKQAYGQVFSELGYANDSISNAAQNLLDSVPMNHSESNTDQTDNSPEDNFLDVVVGHSDILYSDSAIAVPWDYVENGYVTLEMIKAHCDDDLILVQNRKGDVTFIAGNISSKKVTDDKSALDAIKSLFGVLNLEDSVLTANDSENGKGENDHNVYLKLVDSRPDSAGNMIYEFYPYDEDTGVYMDTVTDKKDPQYDIYHPAIILKADPNGNVLALSSSSSDSFDRFQVYMDLTGTIVDQRYLTATSIVNDPNISDKYTLLSQYEPTPVGKLSNMEAYFARSKETGEIQLLFYFGGVIHQIYDVDEKVYEESGGKDCYPYSTIFSNAETSYMTFTDYHGFEVSLPVIRVETDGEYVYSLASKDYKVFLFQQDKETESSYLVSFKSPEEITPMQVSLYSNALETRKYYYEIDKELADSGPLVITYSKYDGKNAYGGQEISYYYINEYNCSLLYNYDATVHELTHTMTQNNGVYHLTGYAGAISEGIADVVSLSLTQAKYDQLYDKYMQEHPKASTQDAIDYLCEHFEDFSNDWNSSYDYNNGNPIYLYSASDPASTCGDYNLYATTVGDKNFGYYPSANKTDDNYNSHANSSVLSHIAYQMYKTEIVKDPTELATIWYDACRYICPENEFYDIRFYVEEIMKERGYSQEAIAKTDQIFVDANVTLETRNANLLAVPKENDPSNILDPLYGTYNPELQESFDSYIYELVEKAELGKTAEQSPVGQAARIADIPASGKDLSEEILNEEIFNEEIFWDVLLTDCYESDESREVSSDNDRIDDNSEVSSDNSSTADTREIFSDYNETDDVEDSSSNYDQEDNGLNDFSDSDLSEDSSDSDPSDEGSDDSSDNGPSDEGSDDCADNGPSDEGSDDSSDNGQSDE